MSIETYSDFQALASSEKIGLVQLEAAKRLMGWVLHSGSVYKLTGFDYSVIVSIEDSGTPYVSVASLAEIGAGKFFNDRANRVLYLQASDSSNPNSRFLAMVFRMFFSNVAVIAPHDLANGYDVEWLPTLESTSQFGVELDRQYQMGEAIEGSGTIVLKNDQEFWKPIFDKLYFDNQRVFIYSWNRELPITEAKIIYRGRIVSKKYDEIKITFGLKDYLNELRAPVPLADIGNFPGARVPESLKTAKQRLLYGYVHGHRPTNIDQVVVSYPITGTVALTGGSATITGTGTQFLKELSPDDQIFFGNDLTLYTIADVASDTSATLTEVYAGLSASGVSGNLKPSHPKRWINRQFLIAGHALAEPTTTVAYGISTLAVAVDSTVGLIAGDEVVIGTESSRIERISGNKLILTQALSLIPEAGTVVMRPSVSSVFLNEREFQRTRDYVYDAEAGTLTLDELAEFNVAPVRSLQGQLTFTSGSRSVSGGTALTKQISPGDWIRNTGQSAFFEVLKVVDDTTLLLRTSATYSVTGPAQKKSPEVYSEGSSVLSCDCLGVTEDGSTSGALLWKAPGIVKNLLERLNLSDSIDLASFALADQIAEQRIGIAIPTTYNDKKSPAARDVINRINQSVFGALIQDADFQLEYSIFSPRRPTSVLVLKEFDILKFSVESKSDNIVKVANVEYLFKEYDPTSKAKVNYVASKTSKNSQFLAKTLKEKSFPTVLVDAADAQILANRWAFILEVASSVLKIRTKLQAARSQVNDPVLIQHEKLYERVGSTSSRKVASIQSAKKAISGAEVELEDLANAFSRCSCIAADGGLPYDQAPETEKVLNGYITDAFGMQSNDPETFNTNLIW